MTENDFDYIIYELRCKLSTVAIETNEPVLHVYDRVAEELKNEMNLDPD